jgi:hypothetical protein
MEVSQFYDYAIVMHFTDHIGQVLQKTDHLTDDYIDTVIQEITLLNLKKKLRGTSLIEKEDNLRVMQGMLPTHSIINRTRNKLAIFDYDVKDKNNTKNKEAIKKMNEINSTQSMMPNRKGGSTMKSLIGMSKGVYKKSTTHKNCMTSPPNVLETP